MSIIIRLQNLPLSANSLDIRRYFQGLSIPDGGVHIVGGEKGDAFIAFVSDEDARQAMSRDNGMIKDTPIRLFLSSRNEMLNVIDMARNKIQAMKNNNPLPPETTTPKPNRDRSRSPINRNHVSNGQQQVQYPQVSRPLEVPSTPMGGLQPLINPNVNQNITTPQNFTNRLEGYPNVQNVAQGLTNSYQNDNNHNNSNINNNQWRPGDFQHQSQNVAFVNTQADPRLSNLPQLNPALNPSLTPLLTDPRTIFQQNHPNSNQLITFNGKAEVRGLSPSTTSRDIHEFLKSSGGLIVPEHDIRILVDDRGYPTGGATIRVQNEADLKVAVQLSGRVLGDRRIDIMPLLGDLNIEHNKAPLGQLGVGAPLAPVVSPVGIQQQQQQQQQLRNISPSGVQRDYVIYMKGIPFNSCTDRDVSNFFQGLRITDIVFESDRQTGKPAGNAYVEFPTREDYEGALALNLKHMGRRYIEVFPTTKDDMDDARLNSLPGVEKQTHCIYISGLPPTVTNSDLTSYFKEVGALPFAIHMMLKNGTNAGEAYLEFTTPEYQMRALAKNGEVINGYRIAIKDVPFTLMQRIVGRPLNPAGVTPAPVGRNNDNHGRGRGRGNSHRGNRSFGGDNDRNRERRDPFADNRCVIHASNVPYKATNDDLKTFFADFDILPNGIERRMNEKGLATPDARIAFRTNLEAERAAKVMHKKFLLGRQVFLRLA